MTEWPQNVNKKIRRGTDWDVSVGVIADQTRSGKRKVRSAHSLVPNVFNVTMRFTVDEYKTFINWFKNDLRKGALPFSFPRVDSDGEKKTVYIFASDSALRFSNPSGKVIEAHFVWEEVNA